MASAKETMNCLRVITLSPLPLNLSQPIGKHTLHQHES